MRPMLTISAVVLLHLGVIAVLVGVNGCRTTTGFEKDGDLGAYTGAAGVPAATPAYTPGVPVAGSSGLNEPAKPGASKPVTARPAVVAVGKGNTHTVAAGESLWVIARREGVSLDALCAANGLERNAVLRVGQKVLIPDGSTPPAARPAGSTAPATPAAPSPLAAPAGGFGGFGGVPAAPAPDAPAAPVAPAAPKPAEPAPASSPLAAPAGGFGGFGGSSAAPTAPATR
ncbi:MAG: LysM peptidoglycan-binding domain-containing protein [Opitutales bacterium]